MQEIFLKIDILEQDYQKTLKLYFIYMLTLFFLSSSVPLNGKSY